MQTGKTEEPPPRPRGGGWVQPGFSLSSSIPRLLFSFKGLKSCLQGRGGGSARARLLCGHIAHLLGSVQPCGLCLSDLKRFSKMCQDPSAFPALSQPPFLLLSPILEKGFSLMTRTDACGRTQQPRNPYNKWPVRLGTEASIAPHGLELGEQASQPWKLRVIAALLWNRRDPA